MTDVLNRFFGFWADPRRHRLLLLILVGIAALIEFRTLGLARRTFVFYASGNGMMTVEDRMLPRDPSRETEITRYVEEVLLGPVSPDSLPLFPRETRLRSLLYRDGVVYADLSEDAVLPPLEGGVVLANFQTLYQGIRRNFSFVRDVRFFIAGKAAYVEEFRQAADAHRSPGEV